jgi:AcrR family transcriptional regulator
MPAFWREEPLSEVSQSKRQAGAAATHEQLREAARRVFEERGYQATTVGAITAEARTAHGTFYLYFRNKEDAFSSVMEEAAGELMAQATSNGWDTVDRYDALERSIRGFLEVYVAHRSLWRCALEGSFTSPAVAEMWLAIRRSFVARIEGNLRRLLETGLIRPLDPALTANALGSMVEWTATTQFVLAGASAEGSDFDEAV